MPSIFDETTHSVPSSPSVATPVSNGLRGKVTGVTRIGTRAGIIAVAGIGGIVLAIVYGISSSGTHATSNVTAAPPPQILATNAPLIDGIPGAIPTAPPVQRAMPRTAPRQTAQVATQPVNLPTQPPAPPIVDQGAPRVPDIAPIAQSQAQLDAQMRAQAKAQAEAQERAIRLAQAQAAAQAKLAKQQQIAELERNARQSSILVGSAPPATATNAGGVAAAGQPASVTTAVGGRQAPASPYTLQAGSVIPATLLSGINSDLPGTVIAQVNHDVFDSKTGHYLLIPAGSRLIGRFESQTTAGQSRVMVGWQRLIYPDSSSVDITGADGADAAGYSGLSGNVNNHTNFLKTALTSLLGIGATLLQPRMVLTTATTNGAVVMTQTVPNPAQQAAAQAGQQVAQNVQQAAGTNQQQRPTIEVRPGSIFNVLVSRDLSLAAPYKN